MNVSPQLRALIQTMGYNNTYGSTPYESAASTVSADDVLFQDLLMQSVNKGQNIVSAEEILADLDGTPTYEYNGLAIDNGTLNTKGTAVTGRQRAFGNNSVPGDMMDKINTIAKSYGVDTNLVREVVRAESNFNPNAVSRAGAKGLMQLMDSTARSLNVDDSFDPEQNLEGGTKYLRDLLSKYDGNVKVALAAYNAGPGRVDRLDIDTDAEFAAKASQLPKETQRYVEKITSRLNG